MRGLREWPEGPHPIGETNGRRVLKATKAICMSALTRFEADQCTVVFLDHTPSLFPVHSIEPLKLENNVLGLAKVARALGMPVVISSIQPREAALADPLFEKLTRFIYPDVVIDEDDVIERTTFDAFGSERFRRAVEETGERTGIKKLIMCGLWTETSLLQSVTTARNRRRDVAFVEAESANARIRRRFIEWSRAGPYRSAGGRSLLNFARTPRRSNTGRSIPLCGSTLASICRHK